MDNPVVQAEKIKGWMEPEELAWLYETAKTANSIVELGSFEGRSTYVLLAGCPGPVFAVDCFWCGTMHPFEDNERYTRPAFDRNVGHFKNLAYVFEGTSVEAAASPGLPTKVEMTFIDCDHAKESVLADLQNWEPRTTRLLCGHDLSPNTPGVEQALVEYFGSLDRVERGAGTLWFVRKGGQ